MTSEGEELLCPVIHLGSNFESNYEKIKQHLLKRFRDSAAFLFNDSNFPWNESNVAQVGDNEVTRKAKESRTRLLSDRFDNATRDNSELCVHLVEMLSSSAREKVMENEKFVIACDQSDPIMMWNIIMEECFAYNNVNPFASSSREYQSTKDDHICFSEVGGLKVQTYGT